MIHTKTCIICGKEFTTNQPNKIACDSICYRKHKQNLMKEYRAKAKLALEDGNTDLKLWEILYIMQRYNITIQEYLRAKNFYTLQYIRGKEK